ncbi:MAG: hypothetical protein V3V93_07210 [bacterium]
MTRLTKTWCGLLPLGLLGLAGLLLMARPAAAQQGRRALPPLSDFTVIEDKNLFHPERISQKPPPSPDEPKPPSSDISKTSFVLQGVILLEGGKSIALLQEPNLTEGKVKSFTKGGMIGDYVLKEVKSDRVIMVLGNEQFEVILHSPKNTPKSRERRGARGAVRPRTQAKPTPK